MKTIQVRYWNGKWFLSADSLNKAFDANLINRTHKPTTYGANYTFSTKDGDYIAEVYKDDAFGFSSQAYGIKLSPEALTLPIFKY